MSKTRRQAIIVVIASLMALAIAGFTYTTWATEQAYLRATAALTQSNQRWCGYLISLDDIYSSTPPTTLAGQRVALCNAERMEEYGCGASRYMAPRGVDCPNSTTGG